ncbi:MAG: hypothetical protein ACRDTJ_28225 [Pseudonocardiaceae bacterium]
MARRVGPCGQVLATDISPAVLGHAAAAGLATVQAGWSTFQPQPL